MITKGFLKGCTEEQIRLGVLWLEMGRIGISDPKTFGNCHWISPEDDKPCSYFRPTEDISDSWHIISTEGIHVKPVYSNKTGLVAKSKYGEVIISRDNELRAAMEVYILMSVK